MFKLMFVRFSSCSLLVIVMFINACTYSSQTIQIATRVDSLMRAGTARPFNGVILVKQADKIIYSQIQGYADLEKKILLQLSDQFVVGSISKQFTAVLVLLEYEKGHLDLNTPIKKYLQELKQGWADSITIHQLLTHTHGVVALNKPLAFKPGTQFSYSQIGYHLLAAIVEQTAGKPFAAMSNELFKKYKMDHTFHPDFQSGKKPVKGYSEKASGSIEPETRTFENYPAAGSFISTANDLLTWNENLHHGKILRDTTYKLMMTPQKNAVRDHPVFGKTPYGYGITVENKGNILQLGQTGFAPGFVSMDFYFPTNETSIIVLENISYYPEDLKMKFFYHQQILNYLQLNFK